MNPEVITLLINISVSAIVGLASASYTLGKYKEKVDSLIKESDKLSDKCNEHSKQLAALEEFKVSAQKFQKLIDKQVYNTKTFFEEYPIKK